MTGDKLTLTHHTGLRHLREGGINSSPKPGANFALDLNSSTVDHRKSLELA